MENSFIPPDSGRFELRACQRRIERRAVPMSVGTSDNPIKVYYLRSVCDI